MKLIVLHTKKNCYMTMQIPYGKAAQAMASHGQPWPEVASDKAADKAPTRPCTPRTCPNAPMPVQNTDKAKTRPRQG